MNKLLKSKNKLKSIVLIVVGAGLLLWGYQKSGGLDSQLSSVFTGSPTDSVMLFYIAGSACLAVGLYLFIKK